MIIADKNRYSTGHVRRDGYRTSYCSTYYCTRVLGGTVVRAGDRIHRYLGGNRNDAKKTVQHFPLGTNLLGVTNTFVGGTTLSISIIKYLGSEVLRTMYCIVLSALCYRTYSASPWAVLNTSILPCHIEGQIFVHTEGMM